MGLKFRGEVLRAGKHPGCRARVLSGLIPSCFPQPCAEVSRELCLCQVLDLGWWNPVFLWPVLPWEDQQHVHLPGSSSLNLSPQGCARSLSPTALSYLLSSPARSVQRAFKQVEVGSLARLRSRHGAGAPMVALQPGTRAGVGRTRAGVGRTRAQLTPPVLPAQRGARLHRSHCWSRRS